MTGTPHPRIVNAKRAHPSFQTTPPTPSTNQGWSGRGSTSAWRRTRDLVIRRDGHRCQACGKNTHPRCSFKGCGGCTHVGHWPTPKAEGGTDHPSNLRVECQACNLAASARRSTAIRALKRLGQAALKTSRQW